MNISVVLLAAGNSSRFDGNKLLEELDGMPVFTYAFDAVKEAQMRECITGAVVVTQYLEIVMAARFMDYYFNCVPNEHPEWGISHSLKLGLFESIEEGAKAGAEPDAVMFVVCDQPYLTGDSLCKMIAEADGEHILRASSINGERKGSPTLFPRKYFDELMALEGDEGGRILMQKYPELVRDIAVFDERELMDVDTREDFEQLK